MKYTNTRFVQAEACVRNGMGKLLKTVISHGNQPIVENRFVRRLHKKMSQKSKKPNG